MTTKVRLVLFPLCAAAAVLLAAATDAATIANGSFETGPAIVGGFVELPGGDTSITGWTVRGASVDYIGNYWTSEDGAHSLDLDGGAPGGIEQTFATTPGQGYTVTFYLAGNPECGSAVKYLDVSATGGQTAHYTFDTSGHDNAAMGWQRETYTFIASGASTTLVFQSADADGSACGPALDNVSIADLTSLPTLSPAGVALAALVLAALGFSALARRAAA